jgi:hypothetical protein
VIGLCCCDWTTQEHCGRARINRDKERFHKVSTSSFFSCPFNTLELGKRVVFCHGLFQIQVDLWRLVCVRTHEFILEHQCLTIQSQCLTSQSQIFTNYQSTKIMNEKANHLQYSTLIGTIEDDMWIIDSGTSRHMTGNQVRLSNMNENKTSDKLELGDKNAYIVKGIGQASIKLESGNNFHLSNVLYVPSLEKNLVPISCLEEKGNIIAFVDGEVLSWSRDSSIKNAKVIGTREGRLYRLLEQNDEALVHNEVNPSEIWHRRYAHINHQALPFLKKMVEGIP